ncbi:hypothetical protein M3J09_004342 [Ascochyta lentis]
MKQRVPRERSDHGVEACGEDGGAETRLNRAQGRCGEAGVNDRKELNGQQKECRESESDYKQAGIECMG